MEEAKKYLEIKKSIVYISGGELELTRSSYVMMAWKFKDGK